MPAEKSIRELALELVDANDELCWINKHSHPQTWSALKNKYDKALDALRAALDGPDREKELEVLRLLDALELLRKVNDDRHALQERLARVTEAAQLAAATFRHYEQLHRAKPDHVKADANAALATTIEATLADDAPGEMVPNNDKVICPNCCHQFRAVPVNVQRLMLDAGLEPPFMLAAKDAK